MGAAPKKRPRLNLYRIIGLHAVDHEDAYLPVATKSARLLAFTFDGVLLGVTIRLVLSLVSLAFGINFVEMEMQDVLFIAVPVTFAYYIIPQFLNGQTLGKQIVKIKVVRVDARQSMGLGRIFVREAFGKSLSLITFGVGFFLVLTRPDRRAFHDLIAGTKVVSLKAKKD